MVALEDYRGGLTPILHRCREGHSWEARPSGILNGKSCPWCSGLKTAPCSDKPNVDGSDLIDPEAHVRASAVIEQWRMQCIIWKGRPINF